MPAPPINANAGPLSQPVSQLWGVGPERQAQLARVGITTVEDLLLHRPRRYEDRRHFRTIRELQLDEPATTRGTIVAQGLKKFRKGAKSVFEIILEDGTARLHCRWWNLPYMQNYFSVGDEVFVYGKPLSLKPRTIDHPESEVIEAGDELAIPVTNAAVAQHPMHYTTRAGDTLVKVADRFNVSVEDLRRWNHLSSSTIRPQHTLAVSEPARLAPATHARVKKSHAGASAKTGTSAKAGASTHGKASAKTSAKTSAKARGSAKTKSAKKSAAKSATSAAKSSTKRTPQSATKKKSVAGKKHGAAK